MVISDIYLTKRGKYALFSDGEFLFSVDESTFVEYSLYKGMEVDEVFLTELKDKSDFAAAKAKAYELLSYRDHTRLELLDKMTKRYDELTAEKVVFEITRLGYIDEEKYARNCLEYLFKTKLSSIYNARMYLLKRGIGDDIANQIIEEYAPDERAFIRYIFETRYFESFYKKGGYEKVFGAFMRKGFRYDDIHEVLSEYYIVRGD